MVWCHCGAGSALFLTTWAGWEYIIVDTLLIHVDKMWRHQSVVLGTHDYLTIV